MNKKAKKGWLENFRQCCRQNRLNITPQRTAIYEVLIHADNHPTAEEVFRQLASEFPDLSLDTVYRTLATFSQIGLINRIEGYGQAQRYDPNIQPHHHFHCLKCNRIADFENSAFSSLKIPDSIQRKFRVSGLKVVLEGLCERCLTR